MTYVEYSKLIDKIFLEMKKTNNQTIELVFFEGISFTSKLIRWWTRSKFSHVGIKLIDQYLSEAWTNTGNSLIGRYLGIFGARWQLSTWNNHTKGTPYVILTKEVDEKTYNTFLELTKFFTLTRIPYDWKEIIEFVIPGGENLPNGKFVCSTGTAYILQHCGLLPLDISYWKLSPGDLYDLCLTCGFKVSTIDKT